MTNQANPMTPKVVLPSTVSTSLTHSYAVVQSWSWTKTSRVLTRLLSNGKRAALGHGQSRSRASQVSHSQSQQSAASHPRNSSPCYYYCRAPAAARACQHLTTDIQKCSLRIGSWNMLQFCAWRSIWHVKCSVCALPEFGCVLPSYGGYCSFMGALTLLFTLWLKVCL